jgi:hypothetical protein
VMCFPVEDVEGHAVPPLRHNPPSPTSRRS